MSSPKIPKYIPIDAFFIDDRRIKRLNKDLPNCSGLGMVLGLYFYLIKEPKMQCSFDDIDLIADELRTSVPLLKTVITNYNLFQIIENKNKKFFSPYLEKQLIPYFEKCETNRTNALIGVAKRKLEAKKKLKELELSLSDSSERPPSECRANRKEKNIARERKINEDYEYFEDLTNKQLKRDMRIDKLKNLAIKKNEIDI